MGAMRLLFPLWGLLLVSLAEAAASLVASNRAPPLVNGAIDSLQSGTSAAKIAALKAKAAAAVSRAQAAAALASTSEVHVEQLKMQNEKKKPQLADSLAVAKEATVEAVAAAKEAVAALAEVKAVAKTAVADARRLAVEEVKQELTNKYHQLEQWRSKVLDDPYTRAKKAGAKAAAPFNKMIKAYYGRIGQYQLVAGGMMSKANKLAAGAQSVAGGAQGRYNGGDTIGANQDIMTANAMRKQSAGLAGAANALQGEAKNMNQWIGQYIAAGHMAAWRAEYDADPDVIPPPPLNPDYAFTPPPPAA